MLGPALLTCPASMDCLHAWREKSAVLRVSKWPAGSLMGDCENPCPKGNSRGASYRLEDTQRA